jgi:hypothetical protein
MSKPHQWVELIQDGSRCYEIGSAQSIGMLMTMSVGKSLARLKTTSVVVADANVPDEGGTASIVMSFSDGTKLQAFYWRLIQDGRALLSSFDHQQKYGLPAPINGKEQLAKILEGEICSDAQFDAETADLIFLFGKTTKLQIFNFTGYEIWDIRFPDGSGELSNYALK